MQIKKALITAAGPDQRKLAMQTLVDRDGDRKTVLEILIKEARQNEETISQKCKRTRERGN
ncbi:MAG: hypothetical protein Q8T08_16790 [Ignavibacteria bacterium]|nr:hypothetical protein [Ignavibacteria bacterium]